MYEFKYHRPATVRQAANLLVKNEDAKVIAGGHTLVPVMKQRLANPPHLVDLSHIEGLDTIEMKGRSLVIGATAKHAAVATSACRAVAPITSERPFISMASSPSIWERSTRCGGLASRCFMTGTSVWPPAITLASSFFTSRLAACRTVAGR